MPGWQRTLDPHVKAGALTVIGVVQEQHGDWARLYLRQDFKVKFEVSKDAPAIQR